MRQREELLERVRLELALFPAFAAAQDELSGDEDADDAESLEGEESEAGADGDE